MANETPTTSSTAATQPLWLARIHLTLKPVVLDPQGDAVLTGLHQLGFAEVARVRAGKYLEVSLTAANEDVAAASIRQMCEKLLANPVIERYDFTIEASSTNEQ